MSFWWTVPASPVAQHSNVVFIMEAAASAQNVVNVIDPAFASGPITVVNQIDPARDSAYILIQSITQDYFQTNILKFLPYEYRRKDALRQAEGGGEGALAEYMDIFAVSLDEIKEFIDNFTKLFDLDHCPPRYLRVIAELLNFPLEDTDTVAVQRQQLKDAIHWYKTKGSRRAFIAILYAFGFYADMIPLWTEDYETFSETIPGVATGNDPPNNYPLLKENGGTWYRSPHYGIRLRGILEDKHVFIEWGSTPQALIDEFNDLADEVGYHNAFYDMIDELSAAGAVLRFYFTAEDFNYLFRRIEFLRPVFAVLDWLEFQFSMQEEYVVPEAPDPIMTVNPTRDEKGWYLGYCDLDDVTYTRLDTRLLGDNPNTLANPLGAGAPTVVSIVDEVIASIASAGVTSASGTLANSWIYPAIEITVTIGAAAYTVLDNQEGVLVGEDETVYGTIDYLTGDWSLLFEGVSPDNGTDIVADYDYTVEVPPCDRSGTAPRGSTALPFPHLRNPQEGYCHPPEELDIDWYWLPEEEYQLPLLRNGMNLYPPAGPVPYIDHADFPSRGFENGAGDPDHANTLTRRYGYATRPLSLLRVEADPAADAENWENQDTPWESWTGPWESEGD